MRQRTSALVRPAVALEQAAELPESARSETIDQCLCGFARFRQRRVLSGTEDRNNVPVPDLEMEVPVAVLREKVKAANGFARAPCSDVGEPLQYLALRRDLVWVRQEVGKLVGRPGLVKLARRGPPPERRQFAGMARLALRGVATDFPELLEAVQHFRRQSGFKAKKILSGE